MGEHEDWEEAFAESLARSMHEAVGALVYLQSAVWTHQMIVDGKELPDNDVVDAIFDTTRVLVSGYMVSLGRGGITKLDIIQVASIVKDSVNKILSSAGPPTDDVFQPKGD